MERVWGQGGGWKGSPWGRGRRSHMFGPVLAEPGGRGGQEEWNQPINQSINQSPNQSTD